MYKSVYKIAAALALSSTFITVAMAQNSSVTAGSFPTATTANADVVTGDTSTSAFRVFNSANTALLKVDAAGNAILGSGTGLNYSAAIDRFYVYQDANANMGMAVENPNTGANALAMLRAHSDTASVNFAAHGSGRTLSRFGTTLGGWSEIMQWQGNGLLVGTYAAVPLVLGTSSLPRLYIGGNGHVGIGTNVPHSFFHVNGTSSQYMIVQRGTKQMYVNANWAGGNAYSQIANRVGDNMGLSLSSKDTSPEFLFVSTGGTVAVGTTAPDPAKKLHVIGDARFDGTVTGTNIQAQYQDVAEWVPSRHDLAPGTVVVLDPQLGNGVAASTSSYDTAVAGVVSVQPGIILGEASTTKEMIATTGRVKVKVDARRAPIAVGDLLVTSDERGVAMRSEPMDIKGRKFHQPGTIIGKALEPLAGGQGEILVLLSMQ